jgi:DNA polymerase-3 subunit gamma/tau
MPKVLYNKYRSSDFDQLIGQEHITKILKNAVKTGRVSHSYLFVGSRGTGKTSTARILSKALNCLNIKPDGNPCNECEHCLDIVAGKFMDLIEIDAASNRGIDQIRELKEKLEFSPVKGKYKIYIVDEVHMLTKEAFNALLKTLEEPPAHVIFMLATTDVHKLPPTILSRCQRYDFRLGTSEQIKKVISDVSKSEGFTFADDALNLLVESAKGSYRDSLSLLDAVITGQLQSEKPESINIDEVRRVLGIPDNSIVFKFLNYLFEGDGANSLAIIDEIESRGVNISQFVKSCLGVLQESLIAKIAGTSLDERYVFAQSVDANRITSVVGIFLNADKNLKNAPIPSLVLDMLIVQVSSGNLIKNEIKEKVVVKEVKRELPKVEIKEPESEKTSEVKEEEEEEEDGISQAEVSTLDLTLDQIQGKWKEIVDNLKPAKGRLFAFLANARLLELRGDSLKLEVPFEFYKEQIENSSNKEVISNVFNKVFGTSFKISCEVNGGVKRKKMASSDIVMQNVPPKTTTTAPPQSNNNKPASDAPRKISKKVEQIFEGM